MKKPVLNKNITIEDLVNNYSFAVKYLRQKGIKCFHCGDPVSGTLEEASKEKGFSDTQIQEFLDDIRGLDEMED